MNIIIRKVRLVAAPLPPVRGTFCTVVATVENPDWGIYSATLAEGCPSVTVDWGDGCVETLAEVRQVVHTYAKAGTYEARISDDIAEVAFSSSRTKTEFVQQCAGQLRAVRSDAARLTALTGGCFANCVNLGSLDLAAVAVRTLPPWLCRNCASLTGRLEFPFAAEIEGLTTQQPFEGCTGGIAEIRFARENEAAIVASAAYRADPTLGTGTARVVFA